MKQRLNRCIPGFGFGDQQALFKSLWAEFGPAMEGAEKAFELVQQVLAVTLDGRLWKFAKVLDLADQMGQAELDQDATLASVLAIGAPKVGSQNALEVLAQYVHQHVSATRAIN